MTTTPPGPAFDALIGLSVGDALGAQFFVPATARAHLASRTDPPGPWPWTDDTEMACSVYTAHTERGAIDTFDLTHAFARRHDFDRGYGPAANRMLRLVREGGDARVLAAELFDGQGSYGNGAAMRVAPLGAAYAEDPAAVVRPAADTAVITHTHPQAVDGAIAVAVAAAYAVRARTEAMTPNTFLAAVAELTPRGAVHDGLTEAIRLLAEPDPLVAARVLGNGSRTSAVDTVPYALWCAARRLTDYPAAVWEAIAAGGDMDTVAAITGGVVAAHTGVHGIPADWVAARELLPDWAYPVPGRVRPAPVDRPGHLKPMLLPRPCPVPDVVWAEPQWRRIQEGLRPLETEQRWESYTAEGVLHLHRGWTGFEIWSVRVAPVRGGGWRPVSALAEVHPDRYKGAPDPQALARALRLAAEGYGP
ncbi:ADP-ribosylglycohydrolase family protein [Kitasatospora sp. SUK 42]|uniref:ADP-ribosylglycohydrolase family protein n=1 Tax=Kitasatospora sp. SUK 42 TaxID=1588882 RepID=UPI0018C9F256|nr:ADP-ribosylglycohydrolase family protein [Kitasatospora sp. SUK 42]MBV2153879.1 ADP-ribosylglycohydrolase family protein [Kitasatospora sp. SUK 42]